MRRISVLILLCLLAASTYSSAARKRGDLPSSSNGIGGASECPFTFHGAASPYLARFDGHSVSCNPDLGNPDTIPYTDYSSLVADNSNFSLRMTPITWINGGSGLVFTIIEVRFGVKSSNSLTAPTLRTLAFKGNLQLSFLSCDEPSPNGFNSSSSANGASFHTDTLHYGQVSACMDTPNVAIPLLDGVDRIQYNGGAQSPPEVYVQEPDIIYDASTDVTIVDFSTLKPPNGSDAVAYLEIKGVPATTLSDTNSFLDVFGLGHVSSNNGLDYSSTGIHYVVVDASGTRYEGGSVSFGFPSCTLQAGKCAPPANDSVNAPKAIQSGSFQDTADVSSAIVSDANDPASGCYDGDVTGFTSNGQFKVSRSLWYSLNVQTPGAISLSTDGSRYDTRIDVFSGKPTNASSAVSCDDDYTPQGGTSQQQAHIANFTPAAKGTYYIMVSETAKPTGSILEANGDVTPLSGPPYDTGTIPLAASAILKLQVTATSLSGDHSSLAFGAQHLNAASSALAVKVSTTSGTVGSIAPQVTGDFAISSNGCSGVSISGSTTCTVQLTFKPTAHGSRSGTLTVGSNAVIGPLSVALSGSGYAPQASLNATSIPFGGQPLHTTSSTHKVTLTNGGDGPLALAGLTSSAALSPFSYTTTCGSSLAAAATCEFDFTFTPSAIGAASKSLVITDDAPSGGSQQVVSLTGTGIAAVVPQRPARPTRPPTASPASVGPATPRFRLQHR